jgi:pseudaminic acid cytidylyltransferase
MKKLKNKIKRLAIIPARLGSLRIKRKNIKLFNGKPMISYPIRALKESKIFKKIFVSTEHNLIKKISKKYGASVDFLRPKYLSGDKVPLIHVLNNVLSEFNKRSEIYDEIWLVYPCNPLLDKYDIIKAKKKFEKTSMTYPMISVKEFEAPIEWAFEKKNGIYKPVNKKKIFTDSKKIKNKYFETASFVIYTRKQLLNNKKHYNYYGYLMKRHKSIDIDTKNDWEHALKLFCIKD